VATFRPSERYVNSISYIPPASSNSSGYAVTGSQDSTISVFSLDTGSSEPEYTLIGHSENVCCLDVGSDGSIISGSWDKTAKVWKDFKLAYDLKGHQQSVWAVLTIDPQSFLTGSADKTIKLWQQHKAIRTFQGHRDAVRGLAVVPDIGFASCSNDSEIHVWTWEGDVVYTLSGHTSFVYSLAVLPTGDIVSAGEDRSVRVWKDGECSQIIVHPAISVWAVSVMPNGDIVSGCSDSVVRVFSASEDRWAPARELQEYEAKVSSTTISSQAVGDVKKSDLAGTEALSAPGTKPGEVKMVKNGDIIEAHQWDSAAGIWQKIGEVVDAVGQGRKQLYQGKEYDYVFDVDIQDGIPPLKLPYNVTENPYGAAQRFLQSNDLPMTYIDEVVRFIEKNTTGVNIGTNSEYVDPYTGASSYRSTAGQSATSQGVNYADPYTGASRYVSQPLPPSQGSSYDDPFTGGSSYKSTGNNGPSGATTSSISNNVIPVGQYVHFTQANVDAMQSKINQFDQTLSQDTATSSLTLQAHEKALLQQIYQHLSKVVVSSSNSDMLLQSHIEVVMSVLRRWPLAQRFPVLDLCRLLVAYASETFKDSGLLRQFIDVLFVACDLSEGSVGATKPKETNILLLLRAFANCFQPTLVTSASDWVPLLFSRLHELNYQSLNKNQRTAYTTVLFNFSCAILTGQQSEAETLAASSRMVLQVISSERDDPEPTYRSLVALGNMVYSKQAKYTIESQASDHRAALLSASSAFSDERITKIVNEILTRFL
jgi:phospholipase A-2-activating protein